MLRKKNLLNFYFYPPSGPPKTCTRRIFWKYHILVYKKGVLRPWCQNTIFSTIKTRLTCKIWVLYMKNPTSYVNFSFVKVMQNLNIAKFWNPEILLKYRDFWLILCMWPLNIPITIAIYQHGIKNVSFLDFLGEASDAPHGSHRIRYPMGGRVNTFMIRRWFYKIVRFGYMNTNARGQPLARFLPKIVIN